MFHRNIANAAAPFGLVLMLVVGTTGCNVKLIADYDETVDKSVTTLQRKLATFYIDLESNIGTREAAHGKYADTYKDIRVDISALELRVNALPQNKITQDQIKYLKENISNLEKLHKSGFGQSVEGKKAVLMTTQKGFDTALAAILRLELAKKRGKKTKE